MNTEQAQAILTFAGIFMRLVGDGIVTVKRLREIAATAGATPEELLELDQRLSEAIARRESGH